MIKRNEIKCLKFESISKSINTVQSDYSAIDFNEKSANFILDDSLVDYLKMDRSLTSTLKSTPFSINDILTKNNTTIFRRCGSSGHLSPIDRKSVHESECDEPSDGLSQHLANSMSFFKYSTHNYEHDGNIDQSMRHPSQHYLFNNNNNNSGKVLCSNDMKNKRNTSTEKTTKSIKYYDFPLMFERPLDMRRCADGDDSGENQISFSQYFFFVQSKAHLIF